MIADFGLSVLCTDQKGIESINTAEGTCGFVAPEFLGVLGKQKVSDTFDFPMPLIEPNSDVFSVGIMFYVMLTGHSPWKGAETLSDKNLIKKNKECKIDTSFANILLRKFPEDIRRILGLMLERDPKYRISADVA